MRDFQTTSFTDRQRGYRDLFRYDVISFTFEVAAITSTR